MCANQWAGPKCAWRARMGGDLVRAGESECRSSPWRVRGCGGKRETVVVGNGWQAEGTRQS